MMKAKRIVCIVLSLIMALAMMPMAVSAGTVEQGDEPPLDILPAFNPDQMVLVGVGEFEDIHYVAIIGEEFIPVSGTVVYQVDGVNYDHASLAAFLATQSAGTQIDCSFSFTGSGDYADFTDSGTIQFTLVPAMDAVEIKMTAPKTGLTLAAEVTATAIAGSQPVNNDCLRIDEIKWSPADTTAAAETVYTVTITIKADRGMHFANAVSVTVNGAAAQNTLAGDTLTLVYTFAKTGAASEEPEPGDAHGPMGPIELPNGDTYYPAYIYFFEMDENGDLIYDESDSWTSPRAYCVFAEDVIYNTPTGEELSPGIYKGMEGATYDRATNILTVTDLAAENMLLETNVMGDDFTVRVVGDCSVGQIRIWGDGYGGALNLEGNGTLTVNAHRACDNAIVLNAEYAASSLHFGREVTVNLYAKQDVAVVRQVPIESADKAFSFANGIAPNIVKEPLQTERPKMINGCELADPDDPDTAWRADSAMKAVCQDDPDGIYAVNFSHVTHSDGTEEELYEILKLIYNAKYDVYFKDFNFSYEHGDVWGNYWLTPEEFYASPYKIVYDENDNEVWLENLYSYRNTSYVFHDANGNEYAMAGTYQDDEWISYALHFELIEGFEDFYIFTPAPEVDVSTLEQSYAVTVYDDVYVYTLTGTEFFYAPAAYIPGNIDNDPEGIVDLSDVVVLAQVVAEWDVPCNEAALDVNGDSKVDLQDIVHLAQYVAGWEGIVLH